MQTTVFVRLENLVTSLRADTRTRLTAKSFASKSCWSVNIQEHKCSSSTEEAHGTRRGRRITYTKAWIFLGEFYQTADHVEWSRSNISIWMSLLNLVILFRCVPVIPNGSLTAFTNYTKTNDTWRQTMPKLGNRGIIAIATIGFYAPVAILTLVLLVRYALRRDAGWLFLFIFSLGMVSLVFVWERIWCTYKARMAGGALLVAARAEGTNVDLFIASYIIDAAALSFLMMSTLGFLGMV